MTTPTWDDIRARCEQVGPCLVWRGSFSSEGRPIWHASQRHHIAVRRIVLEHRTGAPIAPKTYACCVCPFGAMGCLTHLKALTRQEQMLQASKAGRLLTGAERTRLNMESQRKRAPKMSLERAEALRQRRKEGATLHELGAEFGIHFSLAHRICTGKAWAPPPVPVQRIATPPGRYEVTGKFDRVITGDWMLRRQGVDVAAELRAAA